MILEHQKKFIMKLLQIFLKIFIQKTFLLKKNLNNFMTMKLNNFLLIDLLKESAQSVMKMKPMVINANPVDHH